ncbi:Mss4-like protein [Aspergillus filifer]
MMHSISCLCGTVVQQGLLDRSIDALNVCHCADCRAVSGQICTSYYRLQTKPNIVSLVEYQQSDTLDRYFCGVCGAHVFAYVQRTGHFFVASGVIDDPPQTENIRHWGVNDTEDGGLSSFLPGDVQEGSLCWLESHSGDQGPERTKSARQRKNPAQLLLQCHCEGIELYITPPDSSSEKPWSPWPDLIVPYYSADSAENKEDAKWWLRAAKTKYIAGTCACRTCRKASGFPIQTWAFIPKSNILTEQQSETTFREGTLKRYDSSPGVYREFCGRCGASVFWHCDQRPLLIDVSVGSLRAESGARAEEWLEWATGRTSFAELAVDKSLIRLLEAGMKAGQ